MFIKNYCSFLSEPLTYLFNSLWPWTANIGFSKFYMRKGYKIVFSQYRLAIGRHKLDGFALPSRVMHLPHRPVTIVSYLSDIWECDLFRWSKKFRAYREIGFLRLTRFSQRKFCSLVFNSDRGAYLLASSGD